MGLLTADLPPDFKIDEHTILKSTIFHNIRTNTVHAHCLGKGLSNMRAVNMSDSQMTVSFKDASDESNSSIVRRTKELCGVIKELLFH